jgi:hypothetical protein
MQKLHVHKTFENPKSVARTKHFFKVAPSALRAPPPAKLREDFQHRSTNLLGELSEGLRGPRLIALFIATLFFNTNAQAEITRLPPGATFDWVLSEAAPTKMKADIVDLDLFDAPAATIKAYTAAGKKTVCYINIGAWENWRPDKAAFPNKSLGADYDGWPGEKWLNIADPAPFKAIMLARLDLCKSKGFWGVEPDNMNLHDNKTGFTITRQDQIDYAKWFAAEAHTRGLSIGMKNAPDLLPELQDHFDWALLEDCFKWNWCAEFAPMIKSGKAVFAVEYTDTKINFNAFCKQAKKRGMFGLMKRRELGAWTRACK